MRFLIEQWRWLDQQFQHHAIHSMRGQVALLIASLSFIPNLVVIGAPFFRPNAETLDISSVWIGGLILWIMILALCSAAVGYLSSYYMLRPLTLLAQELSILEAEISQPGHWQLTHHPHDPHEARILRRAFSRLLQQVQIEQQRRDAFAATLMHDLKTPLIAFHHLLRILQQDQLAGQERSEVLRQLLQENERVLELVQRMVNIHRLEQQAITLRRRPCDLGRLARDLIRRMRPLAQARQLQLTSHGNGWAEVDRSELERALYNLVDNAIRYARHQVQIEVSSTAIRVKDDGPGLPAPLDHLTQPYTATLFEVAGKRYTAGSGGLGLFIAQRIMIAHGGGLELEQTGSEGTSLVLTLGHT